MELLLWIGVILLVLALLWLRWVPVGKCLVVLHRGEVRRVVGPGMRLVDPLREHGSYFDLDPQEFPLVVRAVTREGHELVVLARAELTVSDPATAARTVVDAAATTSLLAEEMTATFVAERSLEEISPLNRGDLAQLLSAINLRASLWGVRVDALHIDEVDVRLVTP